ncbi:MAG: hypothetical protein JWQ96_3132 [Segetibacter sp.]|nr:hypothetical protein [Segetibacter sp.]
MQITRKINTTQLIGVFILLLLPALYAYNPLPLYFLNDDFIHVPLSQEGVWGQRNSIRPFGDFSLYFDSLLWGTNAVGYHLTNLIIHCVCTVFIYFLSLQILPQLKVELNKKNWSAAIAIFFFGYAFHGESVFWIIGRTGCLATVFFLACFIIFLSGKRKWYHYLISYLAFFCGLLTYESIWVLPPILILLFLSLKKFRGTKNVILIAGYWLLFACYFYLRIIFTGEVAGNYEGGNIKALNILSLISNYAKLVARSFVGPQQNNMLFLATAIVMFVLVLLAVTRCVKKNTFSRNWLIYIAITLFSFTPYISLGIDTHGVEAERYLYLPSVFVCILLVALLASFKNFKLALVAFGCYFIYNQYYLLKESNAFKTASFISKTTIEQMIKYKESENFYIQNLPREHYGVPIFRLGLEEGINWLSHDSNTAKKIRVLSFNEDKNYRFKPTPVIVNEALVNPVTTHSYYTRPHLSNDEYTSTLESVSINPGRDLLLRFTDREIRVIK